MTNTSLPQNPPLATASGVGCEYELHHHDDTWTTFDLWLYPSGPVNAVRPSIVAADMPWLYAIAAMGNAVAQEIAIETGEPLADALLVVPIGWRAAAPAEPCHDAGSTPDDCTCRDCTDEAAAEAAEQAIIEAANQH